ncbi:glycosyltransferase family 39 protein [Roseomonas sp. BN140053]|uniref:glycosyltransferase family 39 protein n=1 Tax=Roseomonas sp. BN140053 TaxID=3391898 RepID=UPI0039EC480C
MPDIQATRFRTSMQLAVLGCAALAGLLLRLHNLAGEGLWLDELWAATFTQLGLQDTLVAVLRFDVHPPLYYLQLNAWAALFGRSDAALLANSVFWGMATLAAVHLAARRLLGSATATLAVAVTAVAGGEVFYAQELRMYAMMSCLAVIAWYAAARFATEQSRAHGIGVVLDTALLAASHGASVVPVSCVGVFLLLRLGIRESLRPRALLVYALIGLSLLPWLINSFLRGVTHIAPLSLQGVASTVGGWLFGFYPAITAGQAALGCAVVALAAGAALLSGRALRDMALAFLLWPVLFGAAVSVFLRPIWIARGFEFCAPFACIAVAALLVRAWQLAAGRTARFLRAGVVGAGLALLLAMATSSSGQAGAGRKMEYREAAAFLRTYLRPGDVVYTPALFTYWGVARYLVGPSWGDPLAVMDPLRPVRDSNAWDSVYARLGRDWIERLHLLPRTRSVPVLGAELVIGWTPSDAVRNAATLWVVGSGDVRPEDLALCEGEAATRTQFRGMAVHQVNCRR